MKGGAKATTDLIAAMHNMEARMVQFGAVIDKLAKTNRVHL